MSICVGVNNNPCGKEFIDTQYPDDTLCNECFDKLADTLLCGDHIVPIGKCGCKL